MQRETSDGELFSFVDEEFTKKALENQDIQSLSSLQKVVKKCLAHRMAVDVMGVLPADRFEGAPLKGLGSAILHFECHMQRKRRQPSWSFYKDLLPSIVQWATQFEYNKSFPVLHSLVGNAKDFAKISVTRNEARFFLANAFFLNLLNYPSLSGGVNPRDFGQIDLSVIYCGPQQVAADRVECFLSYFSQLKDVEEGRTGEEAASFGNEEIEFMRIKMTPGRKGSYLEGTNKADRKDSRDLLSKEEAKRWISPQVMEPEWELENTQVTSGAVRVHTARMEEPKGVFVNFANALLHIGCIIPSLTQEEVLFSCCPEAFVGMLFTQRFDDMECMIMTGLRRFNEYTGYLSSFRYAGEFDDPPLRLTDSVVLDAVVGNKWTKEEIDRDLNKAYLAFESCRLLSTCPTTRSETTPDIVDISTGHWGCGAFGGNKSMKFLQQCMAAAVSGIALDYSTFKEEETKTRFEALQEALACTECTVGQLYKFMCAYKDEIGGKVFRGGEKVEFHDFILEKILSLKE